MTPPADTGTEIGQIRFIAEPYAWLTSVASRDWFGQYELEGIPKCPAEVDADASSQRIRHALLDQVDLFVAVLAAEGWQVMDTVRVDFRTEVDNFKQTLAGELMVPSEQRGVRAEFSIRIGRAK